jgi:hypothetical protein
MNYSNILKKELQKENSLWLLRAAKASLLILLVSFISVSCLSEPISEVNKNQVFEYQEGDIILQGLNSLQCQAVKAATNSQYSHCGIVLDQDGELKICEAVGPVIISSISDFTESSQGGHYVVLRLKNGTINHGQLSSYCRTELGKPYDIYFNWDDTEIYCSELVWKAYEASNIELCKTRPLQDYDLTSPLVHKILQERYASKIPYAEPMVAPEDFLHTDMLEVVFEN